MRSFCYESLVFTIRILASHICYTSIIYLPKAIIAFKLCGFCESASCRFAAQSLARSMPPSVVFRLIYLLLMFLAATTNYVIRNLPIYITTTSISRTSINRLSCNRTGNYCEKTQRMLNVKGLSELLTQNTDEKLCKRWWLMTPNGTLLAYSEPSNVKEIRRQSAMVALSWQEYDGSLTDDVDSDEGQDQNPTMTKPDLKAITIETLTSNFIATKLQLHLLLVLEGGVPPRRQDFESKTTAEHADSDPYPGKDANLTNIAKNATISSRASSTISSAAMGVLRLQRRKLNAMADAIISEFESTSFEMPDDVTLKFF